MIDIDFAKKYLRYYINAKTQHGIHSPFIFKLVDEVIYDKSEYPVYARIERKRKSLLNNKTKITLHEMGGHKHGKYQTRICDVVRSSAKQKKYCTLLYRLVREFKPKVMIEMGTSFGVSTMYQAAANPENTLITLEGNSLVATIANEYFKEAKITNIRIKQGNFDDTFPLILSEVDKIDWLFIDGNHRIEPTLRYFEMALPKMHDATVFVIDDINWSEGMKEAWEKIKAHPQVTPTIDLFMMGIVFFRKDLSKEHFSIRY